MRFTLPPERGPAADPPAGDPGTEPDRHGPVASDAGGRERAARAVGPLTTWWAAERRSPSGEVVPSPQQAFADNSKPVADAVDNALKWLGVLLPVYLTIRIFGFADFRTSVALEVVRQQGVSGIAEAALASLFTEIAGLVVLAGAVLALRKDHPRQQRLLGALLGLLGAAFAPLLVLALALLLVLTFWGRGGRLPLLAAGLLAAATVLVPALSSAWIPHERVTLPGQGAEGAECFVDGYVLGRQSGAYYSVMVREYADHQGRWGGAVPCESPMTRVRLAGELGSRVICRAPETVWDFVDLSVVRWVAGDVRTCARLDLPSVPEPEPVAGPQRLLAGALIRPVRLPVRPPRDRPCRDGQS